jgi:hypothetical protein
VKGLQSQVNIRKTQAPQDDNSASKQFWNEYLFLIGVTNVKLTLNEGAHTIYGELTISDFLVGEKNKTIELGQR